MGFQGQIPDLASHSQEGKASTCGTAGGGVQGLGFRV